MLLSLLLSSCGESNPEAEKVGAQAAAQWLSIVDRGDYEGSWFNTAAMFQSQVAEPDWVIMVGGVRTPLGALRERSLDKTSYATSLPGAPDGEYVVSLFKSSYDNKESAIETVTVTKSEDGWKVVGYFIK